MTEIIMSKISEFAEKQEAFNKRQSDAVDAAVEAVQGLTGDIKSQNETIAELKASIGGVTPEDQALFDALETKGEALAAKMEATAAALKALDALTPPPVPPVA